MVMDHGPDQASTVGPRGDAGPDRGVTPGPSTRPPRKGQPSPYSFWLYLPAGVIYAAIFLVPTLIAFYFSMTRWTLFDSHFIGLDNFKEFFQDQSLRIGLKNTLIYAVVTSGLKVVLGMFFAVVLTAPLRTRGFLRSVVFFPVLVSTVAVGITFSVLLQPDLGVVNTTLAHAGISAPDWLGDPHTALLAVALVDVWKGVGLATVIYIAGILSIPPHYYEAVAVDGGGAWRKFWSITLPLARPATFTVILLSFIGGLRSFDLIWTMTGGGPGFSSDTIASIIYKQYQAGFYGLATAGNIVLFVLVAIIIFPLSRYFNSREVEQ
ncbi:sugar ABC transporter permease [Acidothermaceae bacterium B102]|nr:sugar ABC transporter permease [Acidothermaceae bacterium B102]